MSLLPPRAHKHKSHIKACTPRVLPPANLRHFDGILDSKPLTILTLARDTGISSFSLISLFPLSFFAPTENYPSKKKERATGKKKAESTCKVQEMYTVQDHPPSPNDSLLLPPLDSLHKAHVRNQELPQPGDSRPVKPPCQRAISKRMMKKWEPWDTNTRKSNNSRMFQQLAFHTQQITKATSTQDLDPRPLANNDHPSVLPFEMYVIESGEPPSWSLCWKPLEFLSHSMRRTLPSVYQFRH